MPLLVSGIEAGTMSTDHELAEVGNKPVGQLGVDHPWRTRAYLKESRANKPDDNYYSWLRSHFIDETVPPDSEMFCFFSTSLIRFQYKYHAGATLLACDVDRVAS